MKEGAVIVDVAIDQGGCVETSHPTTHSDPGLRRSTGVIHYCVANMPGGVPITVDEGADERDAARTSRRSRTTGCARRSRADPALAKGVNVLDGKITYEAVAEAHGLEYTPLDDALRARCGLARASRRGAGGFVFLRAARA